MPFLEIGTARGRAAPGQSSPSALITARGVTLVGDATGAPAALARPSAGMFLGSDGTDVLGRYPPGHLLANDFGGAGVTNSTTETSLLTGAVSGGLPAGVAAGDTVEIYASGHLLNTGASQTLTLTLYSGSTAILTYPGGSIGSNASGRHWVYRIRVIYKTIGGAGAGVLRTVGEHLFYGPAAAGGTFGALVLAQSQAPDYVDTTVATNAAANLDLKATLLNNTATTSCVLNTFQARWFPKGY